METKIADFTDGFLVEVETRKVRSGKYESVSDKGLSKKFQDGLEESRKVIVETVNHVTSVWKEIDEHIKVDSAVIEMGLGFEAEGKVFIVKGSAKANLNIKINVSPK